MKVLCLDIEGGHGGSSRSLYELLRHMEQRDVELEVWCRRDGPIEEMYAACGVACRVERSMPRFSALPKMSRNLLGGSLALRDHCRAVEFKQRLLNAVSRFDLVHFNHEALFLLAVLVRRRLSPDTPLSMHVRTNLIDTPVSRWQTRNIATSLDHLIFITENEERNFRALGGKPKNGTVLYNVVTPLDLEGSPNPDDTGEFRIACLSNYDWVRGVDRLVDVAQALKSLGRTDIVFVVAGDMGLRRSLPGELGQLGREGATLADYAELKNVAPMFRFLGHVSDPERVLSECDALIKPTREANPWGRDILEGLAAAKPVISYGTYDTFVETGETGILREDFDADETARDIIGLADDPAYCRALGSGGRSRVAQLCDGPTQAAKLVQVWRSAIAAN